VRPVINGIYIYGIFLIIAIWQGGFPDTATLAGGVFAAAYMLIKGEKLPPLPITILFIALIAAYMASALLNGGRLEGFIGAAKPAAAFLWLCVFYNVKPDVEKTVFISGLALSVLGILTYCGLPPLDGAVKAGRLQGSFQYANAFALYIGVCALLIRLSPEPNRRKYAFLMEIALFLTNSTGGIAVYFGGLAAMCLKEGFFKDKTQASNAKLSGFAVNAPAAKPYITAQLPQILFSAAAAGLMIALFRFVSPYAAILPVTAIWFIQKPPRQLTKYGFSPRLAAALSAAAFIAVVAAAGTRPFATYVERLIQISDGFETILRNPFGIGPGAWGFEFQARQSAFYDAVALHSGFAAIGVSAGVPALICAAGLVWHILKTTFSIYKAALYMIFTHSLFDFSLSFFAITMLLCLLTAQTLNGEISLPRSLKMLFFMPLIVFVVMVIPTTVKNRAMWMANQGRHAEAVDLLKTDFLKRDTEAAVLRLRYANAADLFTDFDAAFDSLKKPNAEAYSLAAQAFIRRGKFDEAAKMAELCAVNSPYSANGYKLTEKAMEYLAESRREQIRQVERLERLKTGALRRINPLARFLPEDERAVRQGNAE